VLGGTGVGKSSFINVAAGTHDNRVGLGLSSETRGFSITNFEQNGIRFCVVDTPGFDDTSRTDVEILIELANFLESRFRAQFLFSGIVYMHRITDVRFTGSHRKQIQYLRKLCGTQTLRKVVFVTSFWDQVKGEVAEQREAELRDNFLAEEINNGAKMMRSDGSRESAISALATCGGSKVVLQVQQELVEEKKPFYRTAIGVELQADIIQRRESIQKVREELGKQLDKETRLEKAELLKAEMERLRKQLVELGFAEKSMQSYKRSHTS
ncbi:P-loop containing nucleoside triphosphate hydrolase protein, partial [Lentithecium fluviatile CBS 122367]